MGSKPEAVNSQNKQRLLQKKERKKKKKQQQLHNASPQLLETDDKFNKVEEENKKKKSMGKKKRKREEGNNIDAGNSVQTIIASDNSFDRLQDKLIKEEGVKKKKNKSSRKKKRESENKFDEAIGNSDQPDTEIEDCSDKKIDDGAINPNQSGTPDKSKKSRRNKKKNHTLSKDGGKELHSNREPETDEVYNISSEDEDFSNGMKKWIMEYHQSRPGLKVLQQRIDDFITAHEEKQELERKEREAHAAEGGWTVVVHHKGRKKTTDSESGIVVGSVAQAAVEDKMVKKKSKEVGLDFYRFQRREAQRNEIMMLQSKFEQDKKRIQQLRAARKFRPY